MGINVSIKQGLKENLPVAKTDGTIYFCVDDGTLYVDYRDSNNNLQRVQIYTKTADEAIKLTSSAGSATQPIYFKDGKPTATSYSLNKTVPSDAIFTDTTYKAGTGISLSETTFSNSGVRSIASGNSNGTISVDTNGTSADVAVKGLGTAAYTASSSYLSSSNGSVTRVKLNTDTLYSPLVNLSSDSYSLTSNDIGKTIQATVDLASSDINITLTQANSSNIAAGTEIAFCHIFGNSMTITPSGVRFAMVGQEDFFTTGVKISQKYGMAAIKKLYDDSTNGDLWLVQGLVESV